MKLICRFLAHGRTHYEAHNLPRKSWRAIFHGEPFCSNPKKFCIPISPPRIDSSKGPHRVNRAHWPTKENRQNFNMFLIFPVYGKNGLRWPQIRSRGVFSTNPDLADVLDRTDLNFENFYFFDFLDPKFLDLQTPISPNFWISRSPDLQIPRSPNSQISRFPDFQPAPPPAPPDELSDPNLTPLPTHPGIKYVARALAAILGSRSF